MVNKKSLNSGAPRKKEGSAFGAHVGFEVKNDRRIKNTIVDCIDCPAKAGEPCRDKDGKRTTNPHASRRKRAIRKLNSDAETALRVRDQNV